jgi:alkanesulfonate monooxygenase SsuD/methylene tetrahydromethanopterin reductase-like flavin-dependent oxidoreductase (luciferase family)
MRERVLAMKALWTQEQASFHGEFVNFDPTWMWPKPEQKPHPPVLLGGGTDHTLRRVVEFCDGWMPIGFRGFEVAKEVERLKRAAEAGKRDPRSLSITVFGAPADKAALDDYRKAGVDRTLLQIPDQTPDEILRLVDKLAPLTRA